MSPDAQGLGVSPANSTNSSSSTLEAMREREQQFMELLGSKSPERLVHDLRNIINELQLLRTVLQEEGQ